MFLTRRAQKHLSPPGLSSRPTDIPKPFLPPELIEVILHFVADDIPEVTPKLMLISSWFLESLRARLHSVVFLLSRSSSFKFLDALKLQPDIFSKNMKALYMSALIDYGTASEILQICPKITHIAFPTKSPSFLSGISKLRPHHISMAKATGQSAANMISVSLPFFASVTHLSLADNDSHWKQWDWESFRALRKLTHLQLEMPFYATKLHPDLTREKVMDILDALPQLQVLLIHVLYSGDMLEETAPTAYCAGLMAVGDPRCVIVAAPHPKDVRREFEHTARGFRDRWSRAEETVEVQRREDVPYQELKELSTRFNLPIPKRVLRSH